jgi:ABC-type amino acid transport substrate-binding protein
MSAVNAVFASMVSDGTIKKIMDRWSSAPASVFTAKPPARSRAQ